MKRTFIIICLILMSIWLNATTYYIDPSGNNSNAGTSPGTAWLTLNYACAHATSPGDTIHIDAGTYVETKKCVLAEGVSIVGEGQTNSIIKSHYPATRTNTIPYAAITLVSSAENTNGNQSLSNFKLDGDASTGTIGITVWKRSNVVIHDMTIVDFYTNGITFEGFNDPKTLTTRAVGNQLYNCNMSNCGGASDVTYAEGGGVIEIGGQTGMLIHDNVFTEKSRAKGHNGNIVNGDLYHQGTKFYNNKCYKNDDEGSAWNFHIENHNCSGGFEIYNNEFHGGDCIIDMGADPITGGNSKGSYNYSFYVHNNLFTSASDSNPISGTGGQKCCIDIEGTFNYDIWIYFNHVLNLPRFILCDNGTSSDYNVNNIFVCYNILENCGWSGADWTYGINTFQNDRAGSTLSNVYYYNNVILGNGVTNGAGIYVNNVGSITNFNVKNNIFEKCSNNGFLVTTNSGSVNGYHIDNNIVYNNSSHTPYFSGNIVSNYDFLNNLTSNPLFVSTSDFHLRTGSPGINAGVNVGLTSDYAGNAVSDPPEIGAFEYGMGTGISPKEIKNDFFRVYPNPVKDILYISAIRNDVKLISLKLYDIRGVELYRSNETGNCKLDFSRYRSGLYFLQIMSEGNLTIDKVVKY